MDVSDSAASAEKIEGVIGRYANFPDTDETRRRLVAAVKDWACRSYGDGGDGGWDVDVDESRPDPHMDDEVARASDTYSEYRLRKDLLSGDGDAVSEELWKARHDYDPLETRLLVSVRPKRPAQWVEFGFKIDL